jgi:phospholipid/cholesterol/gamma-HCH transport system substrate-binding protein
MSFSERNPVVVGVVFVVVLTALMAGAFFLNRSVLKGGYTVTIELSNAAGLSSGDRLLVAGLRAGQVKSLEMGEGKVNATVQIYDARLPGDVTARVKQITFLGRRVIELNPDGEVPENLPNPLSDGDTIPLARTDVPPDVIGITEDVGNFTGGVDAKGLDTLLASLTDVAADQRQRVAELAEGATRLSQVVSEKDQQITQLLDRLQTVSEAVADRDDELISTIDNFGSTLDRLASRRRDIRQLIESTAASAGTAADLAEDQRAEIDRILEELHSTAAILSRHELDVAEQLAYAGDAIRGFAGIGEAGELKVPWAHVFVTSAGPIGLDFVGGCGGLIDQALDDILGPDPRSCAEQANAVSNSGDGQSGGGQSGGDGGGQPSGGSSGGPLSPPALSSTDERQPLSAPAARALDGAVRVREGGGQ